MLDKISGGETERKMTQTKIVETGGIIMFVAMGAML